MSKLLNITKTAEQLGFSQPAITAQISSLEEAFHVQLFKRNGKRLTLTDAGATMIPHAERMLRLWEETKTAMTSFQHSTDIIRLATSTQIINYFLPAILVDIHTQMPQTRIHMEGCINTQSVVDGIVDHRYDFGFIHDDNSCDHIYRHSIWTEKVLWVASRHCIQTYGFTGDISSAPIIHYTPDSVLRKKFDALIQAKTSIGSPIEYSDATAIKQAVLAGLGISYLPATLIREEVEHGLLIVLEQGPAMELTISLAHHREKFFTLPMYALLFALSNQPYASNSLKDLIL